SCAAETASILCELPEPQIAALASYGYHVGTAFQIVDDVLDFTADPSVLGKPVGSDLRQGNLTLPMIRYLAAAPERNPVRALFDGDADVEAEADVATAVEAVKGSAAIEQALEEARRYVELAKAQLAGLSDNRFRDALAVIADY